MRCHLLSWSKTCVDKKGGGLGIKNLELMNDALVLNQLWELNREGQNIWTKWVRAYWTRGVNWWENESLTNSSWVLRRLAICKNLSQKCVTLMNGNLKWIGQGAGFSVKDTYNTLKTRTEVVDWYKVAWNRFNTPIDAFQAVLVAQDKLLTKIRLRNMGVNVPARPATARADRDGRAGCEGDGSDAGGHTGGRKCVRVCDRYAGSEVRGDQSAGGGRECAADCWREEERGGERGYELKPRTRYNQFGADGGPAARSLKPKIDGLSRLVSSKTGVQLPAIDIKVRSLYFDSGLCIFTPIVYDFYKHDVNKKAFTSLLVPYVLNMALLGVLLFHVGMNNSTPVRHQPKKRVHKPKAN
ncbi:hypothetical protein QQ045_000635 [Rhodiola kirilowii]